ncbi:MAG: hypothetical protein WCO94_17045 [Verrucomicrobiota bacterium]
MKPIPYEPMTGMQVLEMRAILPALVAWLRSRESGAGVSPAIERKS